MVATTRALLLTDVIDSTKLSEALGDARMAQVWVAHDRVARDLLVAHRGREIDKTDGFLLLFESASDAATYASAYHRAIAEIRPPLQARAGLHVGDVILTENAPADIARGAKPLEVDGFAKPTGARIMALALGGQTLLSDAAREALGDVADGCELRSHGHYRLKGLADPMELFELGVAGESPFAPPPRACDEPPSVREWALPSTAAYRAPPTPPCGAPADRPSFFCEGTRPRQGLPPFTRRLSWFSP